MKPWSINKTIRGSTVWFVAVLGCARLCRSHNHHVKDFDASQDDYWLRRRPRSGGIINRSAIEVVHVIQSNHLDLGFTGTFTNVVNSYFREFIPAIVATGKALRHSGGLPPACGDATSPSGFCRHRNHSCKAIACRPPWKKCAGTSHSGNETLADCQALCKASACACFEWAEAPGPAPFKGLPRCMIAQGHSAATKPTEAGYSAFLPIVEPPPGTDRSGWRLRYLAQSYVLSLFLDCPLHAGLSCPNASAVASLKDAVKEGDIYLHAFPHNADLGHATPTVIDAGINVTRWVEATLGVPPSRSLSQRDVPGMPRSVVPLLSRRNISLISVGVNGASMYPRIPSGNIFRWRDPPTGAEVYATWHPRGYGGIGTYDVAVAPGSTHAMLTDWNSDNMGPLNAAEYVRHFMQIQAEFPNAKIVASTLDNFTRVLERVKENIPVVTQDIGDTWVFGPASDARRTAHMRALHRAWGAFVDAGGDTTDPAYRNATRLMIKNIEHTWGYGHGNQFAKNFFALDHGADDWTNQGFQRCRTTGGNRAAYKFFEGEYWHQREVGVQWTRQALPPVSHLASLVDEELESYERAASQASTFQDPAALGFVRADPNTTTLSSAGMQVRFSDRGTITRLQTTASDGRTVEWASADRSLLGIEYHTHDVHDYALYERRYSATSPPPVWMDADFGKHGDNTSKHAVYHGTLRSFWSRSNATMHQVLLEVEMSDPVAAVDYGAPQRCWWLVSLDATDTLSATLIVQNKTATRHGEAMFARFNPRADSVQFSSLGQWTAVTPNSTLDGGSKLMRGVDSGLRFSAPQNTSHWLRIDSLDAAVVALGQPSGFPVPLYTPSPWSPPDTTRYGASLLLFANTWGVGYPQWQPFRRDGEDVVGEENFAFRFQFSAIKDLSSAVENKV